MLGVRFGFRTIFEQTPIVALCRPVFREISFLVTIKNDQKSLVY